VRSIAVRRLHDHDIGPIGWLRVTYDGQPGSADITREDQASIAFPIAAIQYDGCRPEYVAGIDVHRAQPGDDVERSPIGNTRHQLNCPRAMPQRVQWLDRLLPPAGKELGVLLLNVSRVRQHHRTEVSRRGRAPDRPLIPMSNQERETTSMIDVCVRKHDCIDFINRDWEPQILFLTLAALALKETAVE